MINSMGMGLNLGQMVLASKEILQKEKKRDKAGCHLLMEASMKVSSKMMNSADKDIIAIPMGNHTEEVG